MKLGICMEGGEKEFLNTITKARCEFPKEFNYVEIGLAYGETMFGVWTLFRLGSSGVRVIGLELPTWEGLDAIKRKFNGVELLIGGPEMEIPLDGTAVILGRSQETLTSPHWKLPIHAAFVDGCHGKPCVMADFLALEPHVAPGGIVIFHDAGENEQGGDMQKHCNQPIGVRDALDELGLYASNQFYGSERPGWVFIGTIPTQNQCAVFKRTEDKP